MSVKTRLTESTVCGESLNECAGEIHQIWIQSPRRGKRSKGLPRRRGQDNIAKEGGILLEQESNRQKTMEDIDGRLHPAVDGQSLGERRKVKGERERQSRDPSPLCPEVLSRLSHTSDSDIGAPVATLQWLDLIESVLRLIGPVSVFCECD